MSNVAQRSFAGGEIAPSLYGRTDTARYQTSLRACRNMLVQQHGGVVNRPGTKFVASVKDSNKTVRLLKFSKNEQIANNYILEFGDQYMRVHQDGLPVRISGTLAWANGVIYAYGDLVTQGGTNYLAIAGHTSAVGTNKPGVDVSASTVWYPLTGDIYEMPTPYLMAHLPDLQYQQAGEVITIVHPSYGPRELVRTSSTKWQLNLIAFGPSIQPPTNVTLTGGAAGPLTYFAITSVKKNTFEESLPVIISTTTKVPTAAAPTTIAWDIVQDAVSYNVYRSVDGKTYGLILSSGGTPVITEDTAWADNAETATANPGNVGWQLSPGTISNPLAGITAKLKAFDGKYRIMGRTTRHAEPFSLSGENQARIGVYYSRDGEADVFWGYHTLEALAFGVLGATWGPSPLEFVVDIPDNGYASLTIKLRPEVRQYNQATIDFLGFGSPANEEASVQQTFVVDFSGAAPYNKIDWNAGSSSFVDDGDAPDFAIGPLAHPSLFNSANNYPSSLTRYQQRLTFANSVAEQARIWASRIASRKSFAFSTPLQNDDALSFELDGRQANPVKHLLDLGRLIVFTSMAELIIEGDESGVLRPDSINARSHSYNGANRLSPLVVDDIALYVQARGNSVRMINPSDRLASQNTNLSLYASHLFQGKTLADWDFALTPNSIVMLARTDGVLLGLTFIPELDVWGWHRHDTDGFIENVCVIPEGNEDAVYLVVGRVINGVAKRYIERMPSRYFSDITDAWFVDCGLRIDGTNTDIDGHRMSLTGTGFTSLDELTVNSSVAYFSAADIGDSIWFTAGDGTELEVVLEGFTSNVIMTGHAVRDVPVSLQAVSTGLWARARKQITGLTHLEGKSVSVYADGYVIACPNNTTYPAVRVVAGVAVLPRAYKKVLVGLPYISDIETLDIDVAGSRTIKGRRTLVSKVVLFLENTRGIWVGPPSRPTASEPLRGMQEMKIRASEDYYSPVAPITDNIDVTIESNWNSNGRVLIRQVDPLPCSILMVSPEFSDS